MSVIDDLIRHEGFRSKPYCDTEGHLTIGYGLNLDAGITKEEARMILAHRIRKIHLELISRLPYWTRLSVVRQNVLINMAYNLGVDGLMKFKVTLSMIEVGRYEEAAKQMLKSKWAKQVGRRAKELSNMMREG